MKKAKSKYISISVKGIWTCPHCGEDCCVEYDGNPYRSIADDPLDWDCPKCGEFFTVSFYDDEDED